VSRRLRAVDRAGLEDCEVYGATWGADVDAVAGLEDWSYGGTSDSPVTTTETIQLDQLRRPDFRYPPDHLQSRSDEPEMQFLHHTVIVPYNIYALDYTILYHIAS